MQPGIGTLRVFPTVWGRKCPALIVTLLILIVLPQTGLEALETAKTMSNGWMSSLVNSLPPIESA